MLVRVPRQVLRYAIGEEERKALMRRTWETKLEKFGVVNIRVEKCISIVDLWRAIFSAEAAMRIARRCKKLHGDASLVPNGEVCHGGHILINNVKKIWQCQQVLLAPALTPDIRAVLRSAFRACRSTARG